MTYRSKIAVVFLLGFFLDLINMFIASVAFPAMARAFNTTPSALTWVSNGYIAGLTLVILSAVSDAPRRAETRYPALTASLARPPLRRVSHLRWKV